MVASGNESFVTFAGSFAFRNIANRDCYEFEATIGGRYGESADNVIANEITFAAGLDAMPTSALSPFAFSTFERNPIRKLNLRAAWGIGAKKVVWRDADRGNASVSLAALFESKRNRHDMDTMDSLTSTWRASLRAKANKTIKAGPTVATTWFFQPSIDGLRRARSDYLVDGSFSIAMPLNAILSATLTYEYSFDKNPPTGTKRGDHHLLFGVNARF